MATDLFKKYYDNPQKQYIYADVTCPGAESNSDLSFSINNGNAEISNGTDVISKTDLSDINVGLSTYANSSIILQPYSVTPVIGTSHGEQIMQRVLGIFDASVVATDQWKYFVKLAFKLKFRTAGNKAVTYNICADPNPSELIDVEKDLQNKLAGYKLDVSAYFVDNYILFISKKDGFEFFLDNAKYTIITNEEDEDSPFDEAMRAEWSQFETTDQNSGEVTEYYNALYEIAEKYVPAIKYKNGAFRGVVLKLNYPAYNDDDITSEKRLVKLAYVKDNVYTYTELVSGTNKIYYQNRVDVDVDYKNKDEYSALKWLFPSETRDCSVCSYDEDDFNSWHSPDDNSIWHTETNNTESIPDEITIQADSSETVMKVIGLYGYADYINSNDLWIPVGDLYINTTTDDSLTTKNLVSSFVLYNPNDYPVEAKLMTFI